MAIKYGRHVTPSPLGQSKKHFQEEEENLSWRQLISLFESERNFRPFNRL